MAEISRFFGIVVHMFPERGSPYHWPHIHAKYQEFRIVLALDTIEVLAGELPRRQQRLLEGWAELHQEELPAAWQNRNRGNISSIRRTFEIAMNAYPIASVTGFEHVGPYTLRVSFDDGAAQTIDFSPVLYGNIYGPLRDPNIFNQVRIDPNFPTLVWPNKADFDPATLRYWPEYLPQLLEIVENWKRVPSAAS